MARRSGGSGLAAGVLLLIGLAIWIVYKIIEWMGEHPGTTLLLVVGTVVVLSARAWVKGAGGLAGAERRLAELWNGSSGLERGITLGGSVAAIAVLIAVATVWDNSVARTREQRVAEQARTLAAEQDARRRQAEEEQRKANEKYWAALGVWSRFDALPLAEQTDARVSAMVDEAKSLARGLPSYLATEVERETTTAAKKRHEAIDFRRTPADRAEIASTLLGGPDVGSSEVCRAKSMLRKLSVSERSQPAVVQALAKIRAKERAVLQAAHASRARHRGLMCRDGSMSPSCSCGGPRRGCCSHHGGVAGCEPVEPMPAELECQETTESSMPKL